MKPILITNTKELHETIQRLIAEPDDSLRKNLKPWEKIPIEIRRKYSSHLGRNFCVEAIWADALNIPEHLQVIAHSELNRRATNGEPLKFVNH